MKDDRARCFAAGVDDYISKPLDRHRLLSLLEGGSDALTAEPASTVPTATSAACDCNAFIARVGGDASLAREMAQVFLGDARRLRDDLQQSLATGDSAAVRVTAHALKGAAANFNAHAVVAAAAEIEQMGKVGELGGAPATATRLYGEFDRLLAELRAFAGVDICAS
jgi:HPt (histidine-containing phosphotransfer) domain-containing protein